MQKLRCRYFPIEFRYQKTTFPSYAENEDSDNPSSDSDWELVNRKNTQPHVPQSGPSQMRQAANKPKGTKQQLPFHLSCTTPWEEDSVSEAEKKQENQVGRN